MSDPIDPSRRQLLGGLAVTATAERSYFLEAQRDTLARLTAGRVIAGVGR